MSEKNDRQDHDPEHEPTADIPEESLEYEQFSPDQPGASERTIVELQDKPRTRRHARGDGDAPPEPAQAKRRDEPSWMAASVAVVLAACVGAAIALAISNPPEHPHPSTRPTSFKPCAPPSREHHRRSARQARAGTGLTPTRAGGDTQLPAPPQVPATSPEGNTVPSAAPVRRVDAERQTSGGPFSP